MTASYLPPILIPLVTLGLPLLAFITLTWYMAFQIPIRKVLTLKIKSLSRHQEILRPPHSQFQNKLSSIVMHDTSVKWRRKTATAIVRFTPSDPEKTPKAKEKESPRLIINGRDGESYLQYNPSFLHAIRAPFYMCDIRPDEYDIVVTVHGGGLKSQAEAIASSVATLSLEKLKDHDSEENQTQWKTLKRTFRSLGLLTSDPRRKERKKYGLKKARKASQYSKR